MSVSSWLVATARRNLLHQMTTSTPVLEREIAKIGRPFCRNPWPRKVVPRTPVTFNRTGPEIAGSVELASINPGITKRSDSTTRIQPLSFLSLTVNLFEDFSTDKELIAFRLTESNGRKVYESFHW